MLLACGDDSGIQPAGRDAGTEVDGAEVGRPAIDAGTGDSGIAKIDGGPSLVDVPVAPADAPAVEAPVASDAPAAAVEAPVAGDALAVGDSPAAAKLTVDPTSARFDVVVFGSQSAPLSGSTSAVVFHVHNGGDATSGSLHAALSGPQAFTFRILDSTCEGLTLPPQTTCTVTVDYTPPYARSATASLGISDTASTESVTAALDGFSIHGDCGMATPPSLDLGSVHPGASTDELFVEVKSCPGFDVGQVTTAITGPDAIAFRTVTNTCANLVRNSSCLVGVQLAPATIAKTGAVAATLTLTGSQGGVYLISLLGAVAEEGVPTVNPSSVSFGTVPVNQPSIKTVTISNSSTTATGALSVTLAGTGVAQVSVAETTCDVPLAPGASCKITVQYLPADTTGVNGTISVTDGKSTLVIPMIGAATEDAPLVLDAGGVDTRSP